MYSSTGFSKSSSSSTPKVPPAPQIPFQQRAVAHAPLFGVFLTFSSTLSAHMMGRVGYDWALIDMEHAPLSAADMTAMVHATVLGSRGHCQPLVRIPGRAVEWVKWALDSGAAGIVVPMCSTAAEVEKLVEWGRYPPLGQRSFGPFNAEWADLAKDSDVNTYYGRTAPGVAIIPMIESVEGLRNAASLMEVKGISGIFVGPVDMRLSMGLVGADGEEEVWTQALEKICGLGKKLGIPVGIFSVSPDAMVRQRKMGFSFFLVAGDMTSMSGGAMSTLEGFQNARG